MSSEYDPHSGRNAFRNSHDENWHGDNRAMRSFTESIEEDVPPPQLPAHLDIDRISGISRSDTDDTIIEVKPEKPARAIDETLGETQKYKMAVPGPGHSEQETELHKSLIREDSADAELAEIASVVPSSKQSRPARLPQDPVHASLRKEYSSSATSRPRPTTPTQACTTESFAFVGGEQLADEPDKKIKVVIPKEKASRRRSSMSQSEFMENIAQKIPAQARSSYQSTDRHSPDLLEQIDADKAPPAPVIHRRASVEWENFEEMKQAQQNALDALEREKAESVEQDGGEEQEQEQKQEKREEQPLGSPSQAQPCEKRFKPGGFGDDDFSSADASRISQIVASEEERREGERQRAEEERMEKRRREQEKRETEQREKADKMERDRLMYEQRGKELREKREREQREQLEKKRIQREKEEQERAELEKEQREREEEERKTREAHRIEMDDEPTFSEDMEEERARFKEVGGAKMGGDDQVVPESIQEEQEDRMETPDTHEVTAEVHAAATKEETTATEAATWDGGVADPAVDGEATAAAAYDYSQYEQAHDQTAYDQTGYDPNAIPYYPGYVYNAETNSYDVDPNYDPNNPPQYEGYTLDANGQYVYTGAGAEYAQQADGAAAYDYSQYGQTEGQAYDQSQYAGYAAEGQPTEGQQAYDQTQYDQSQYAGYDQTQQADGQQYAFDQSAYQGYEGAYAGYDQTGQEAQAQPGEAQPTQAQEGQQYDASYYAGYDQTTAATEGAVGAEGQAADTATTAAVDGQQYDASQYPQGYDQAAYDEYAAYYAGYDQNQQYDQNAQACDANQTYEQSQYAGYDYSQQGYGEQTDPSTYYPDGASATATAENQQETGYTSGYQAGYTTQTSNPNDPYAWEAQETPVYTAPPPTEEEKEEALRVETASPSASPAAAAAAASPARPAPPRPPAASPRKEQEGSDSAAAPPRPPPAARPPPPRPGAPPKPPKKEEEEEEEDAWAQFKKMTEKVNVAVKSTESTLKTLAETTAVNDIKDESYLATIGGEQSSVPEYVQREIQRKAEEARLAKMQKKKLKQQGKKCASPPLDPDQEDSMDRAAEELARKLAHKLAFENGMEYTPPAPPMVAAVAAADSIPTSKRVSLADAGQESGSLDLSAHTALTFQASRGPEPVGDINPSDLPARQPGWADFDAPPQLPPSESGFFSKDKEGEQTAPAAANHDPFAPANEDLIDDDYDPFSVRPVEDIVAAARAKAEAAAQAAAERGDGVDFFGRGDHSGLSTPTPEGGSPISARPRGFEDDFKCEGGDMDTPTPLYDEDDSEPLVEFQPKFYGEGWELMLRHPLKKKIMADRFWKPCFVRLHGTTLLVYNTKQDAKPIQELLLQASYSLSDTTLQAYDVYGKIHTVKLQHVQYKERVGIRSGQISRLVDGHITKYGLPLEHAAQCNVLLKFGSLSAAELASFVSTVEDVLFKCSAKRDSAPQHKQDEVQIHCYDEYSCHVDKEGVVSDQRARVRMFCLAFVSGSPFLEIGLNDRRRQGKEIVRRKDILPMYTERWIRFENMEFHSAVEQHAWETEQVVKVSPPDGTFFEIMRFRVRPPRNREKALTIKSIMRIAGSKVEIRLEAMAAAHVHRHKSGRATQRQIPCEDIAIRFPIPEAWIYLFREERHWGVGSVHSKKLRPGKVKNLKDRLLGAVQQVDNNLIECAIGEAKYEHVYRALVWRIPRLPEKHHEAYKNHLLRCRFELSSFDLMPETFLPTCDVDFTMPLATVSNTVVRSVSVEMHEDSDRVEKFVRYVAKCKYNVDIDYVQCTDLDMDTAGTTSVAGALGEDVTVPSMHQPVIQPAEVDGNHDGYGIQFSDAEFGGAPRPRNDSSSDEEEERKMPIIQIDMKNYQGY